MTTWRDFWLGPIPGIVIGGIIAIGVGLYFYLRSQREKEPYWSITSVTLIRDQVSRLTGLNVTFNGTSVNNLTVSKIIFWNNGRSALERADITTADPIRIIPAETGRAILDSKVIVDTSGSHDFIANIDSSTQSIPLQFDYLNHMQGAVLQIIHTGTSSSSLNVVGGARNVSNLKKRSIIRESVPDTRSLKRGTASYTIYVCFSLAVPALGVVGLAIVAIGGVVGNFLFISTGTGKFDIFVFMFGFIGVLVFAGLLIYVVYDVFYRGRIPHGLEIFTEDILP